MEKRDKKKLVFDAILYEVIAFFIVLLYTKFFLGEIHYSFSLGLIVVLSIYYFIFHSVKK